MTFQSIRLSKIYDFDTELDLSRTASGFQGAFATGFAYLHGKLTLPDNWFNPFVFTCINPICWEQFSQTCLHLPDFLLRISLGPFSVLFAAMTPKEIIASAFLLSIARGGGGGNFHYKGIYRCAAGMGYTFQASKYMNGYHFHIKSISMWYLFYPKSIWMGKFWKIVYEWGQFWKIVYEWGQFWKMVYEWGQFSIWEVYEWVLFFTWPSIWMGWGSGTPAAHPYPKSWQVNPPPPPCSIGRVDQRNNDFNFHIINFPVPNSNITFSTTYNVYVSHLIFLCHAS